MVWVSWQHLCPAQRAMTQDQHRPDLSNTVPEHWKALVIPQPAFHSRPTHFHCEVVKAHTRKKRAPGQMALGPMMDIPVMLMRPMLACKVLLRT